MNIRCSFCQIPFALGRNEMLAAMQMMDAEKLSHYDAHCPRCRRSTPIPRRRLEMFVPNWRKALKDLEKEMKANPQQEASLPQPKAEPAVVAEAKPSHHHRTRAGKAAKAEEKPAAKKSPTKAKVATKKSK